MKNMITNAQERYEAARVALENAQNVHENAHSANRTKKSEATKVALENAYEGALAAFCVWRDARTEANAEIAAITERGLERYHEQRRRNAEPSYIRP